jgi:hypothetical protein
LVLQLQLPWVLAALVLQEEAHITLQMVLILFLVLLQQLVAVLVALIVQAVPEMLGVLVVEVVMEVQVAALELLVKEMLVAQGMPLLMLAVVAVEQVLLV